MKIDCAHCWSSCFFMPSRNNLFMKNGVFWDVTPCGSCKNRRFRGTSPRSSGCQEFVYNVSSSPILVTLIMESLRTSETLGLARATRCNIPGDGILHSHRRENLKSYNLFMDFGMIFLTTSKLFADHHTAPSDFCSVFRISVLSREVINISCCVRYGVRTHVTTNLYII
jgi:hypothetical protein